MSNEGYFRIPHSLWEDPVFNDLELTYQKIFITILHLMAFKDMTVNDHANMVKLKPGQLMITIRGLAEKCKNKGINKRTVERALQKFTMIGFSVQEVRHKKTIITVTYPAICELINKDNGTRNGTNSGQTWDTKEERKERKEEKEKEKKENPPSPSSKSQASIFFSRKDGEFKNITTEHLLSWQNEYPHLDIHVMLEKMKKWLLGPRGKKRKGNENFIKNFFKTEYPNKVVPIDEPEELSEFQKQMCREASELLRQQNEKYEPKIMAPNFSAQISHGNGHSCDLNQQNVESP